MTQKIYLVYKRNKNGSEIAFIAFFKFWRVVLFLIGMKKVLKGLERPLQGMDLQEKEAQKD